MTRSLQQRLVDLLLERKLATKKQLKHALTRQRAAGGSLGHILIEDGVVSEEDVLVFLAQELKVPPINLARYRIDPAIAQLIPERLAQQWKVVAISRIGSTLTVAMADPTNVVAVDDLKTALGYDIEVVVSPQRDIDRALKDAYRREDDEQIAEILADIDLGSGSLVVECSDDMSEGMDIDRELEESQAAPIVRIVNLLLVEGLSQRASDIHLEPTERDMRVRYRVDGRLLEAMRLPKSNQGAALTRLKIMAGADITEHRLPQDGRFRVKYEGREVDFRVSIMPTTYGEKVVLRALDPSSLSLGLAQLGFLPQSLKAFHEAIRQPFGMILVTGPTGSGKSTTLYSILSELNGVGQNIITIEDPVEYELDGVTQVHVRPEANLTFAKGLRSILRQDPDIILIGEIRDSETADIAVKASLTGHLMLSTLHTNDAPGAITRLEDMGVERYLIASSLILVAAQRLMRRICSNCRQPDEIDLAILKRLGLKASAQDGVKVERGAGCDRCHDTGYVGRIATLETMVLSETLRDLVTSGANSDRIRDAAVDEGMVTLREAALEQWRQGTTTLDEVLRVTTNE